MLHPVVKYIGLQISDLLQFLKIKGHVLIKIKSVIVNNFFINTTSENIFSKNVLARVNVRLIAYLIFWRK